jgi:hypothetical protein
MLGQYSYTWRALRTAVALMLVMSAVLSLSSGAHAVAASNVVSRAVRMNPDAATAWHNIAVQFLATATPPRPAPIPFLDLALVQVAVHDAVQGIDRRYAPYQVAFPAGTSGSPEAAAARAAHDVLVSILPGQQSALDTIYHDYFAGHGLAESDPGVQVGATAAAGIVSMRANDGRVPNPLPPAFTGGTAPGQWRPTPSLLPGPPPSLAPMSSSWLATVPPFTLNSADQFRAPAPPALSSDQYVKEYNEVKAYGGLADGKRSPDQTRLATFYASNYFILLHQTLRDIAAWRTDSIGDNARLLALGTLAMADSFITAWDSKSHYVYWRPITAINAGENDGNPKTQGDPNWQPFLNTPNYPEYSSGANNAAGALTRMLELYFGTDRMVFTVVSTNANAKPKTRTYTRFSDLSWDTVNVRIYQGVHFRSADEVGRTQGRLVAEWAFGHVLRPIGE